MSLGRMTELDPGAPTTEQASYWWVLLNNGTATIADHQAFGEWVARSPERVEAFLQTARLSRALKSKELRWPDTPADQLVLEAKTGTAEVLSLSRFKVIEGTHQDSLHPHDHRSGWRRPLLFAVAAGVASIAVYAWILLSEPVTYETAIGEQRSVILDDGSIVTLNTASSLQVILGKRQRTIHLLSGEALFQVARDKTRPFDVIAGPATVRAIGTQFNVNRRAANTTVTVVEGKVSVSSGSDSTLPRSVLPLSAGERATVAPRMKPRALSANVASATAWTQRRLVFERQSLGEVAEEFNRYNRKRIYIEGAELRNQQVTGVFQANDPDSFIDFLSKIPGVDVEDSAQGATVAAAHSRP